LMCFFDTVVLHKYTVAAAILVPVYCLLRRWFQGGKCHSKVCLDGKTVIITGANTGIGKETAIDLAKRGARVVMGCRSPTRGSAAVTEVKKESGSDHVFLELLDLSSLQSIHEFVKKYTEEYKELHILINNAGIMACPYWKTKDDFEMQFGVNHLGHFALTNLLLPSIKTSGTGRIVNVSSAAHYGGTMSFDDINLERKYAPWSAYQRSKQANVLFTMELARKLNGTDITTYSLHPGVIKTELGRHMPLGFLFNLIGGPSFLKSPVQGAQTTIYCAVEEDIEKHSGLYFSDCALKKASDLSHDEGVAKKLWELSETMTGVSFPQF